MFRILPASLAGRLMVGRPVQINRGRLRGLSGTLVGLRSGGSCLVALDGMESGILVNIAFTSVQCRLAALPVREQGR
jgi:hypothetical protein